MPGLAHRAQGCLPHVRPIPYHPLSPWPAARAVRARSSGAVGSLRWASAIPVISLDDGEDALHRDVEAKVHRDAAGTPVVSPRRGRIFDSRRGQRAPEMGVGRAHGRVSRRRHGGRRSPTWAHECATNGGQPVGYRERKPPSGGSKMKATWRGANAYLRTLVAATRPQTPLISALRAIKPAISTFPTSTWGRPFFHLPLL